MKKIIKILMCSWLFCGQVRCGKELIVRLLSGNQCQISAPDEPNLGHIFKAITNADKPEFADAVLNPMLRLELVHDGEVLTEETCRSLEDGQALTLVSSTEAFFKSAEVSNHDRTWSQERNKHIKHNEERFVIPVRNGLYIALYGVNYTNNGWQNDHNPYWDPESDPERCALAKWFFNENPENMTPEDAYKFFDDLKGIYVHRAELIQRIGLTLYNYVLDFEVSPNSMKGLFTKLLELKNTDELITEDKLPQPQCDGHEWIESTKDFASTYELFKV